MFEFESTYGEELSGVVICVIEADLSAVDANVDTNAKIVWHEGALGAILLENHLALEEGTLWGSRVDYLWLCDHDRLVFEVVEDSHFADSVVLESAFNNAFLEVALESQDL